MRTLFLAVLFALISNICVAQGNSSITDRRNIYDEKGDFYFDKEEYKKAIVYYNMAFQKDVNNFYSVLRKAEAYTELELYPQAAECYRIIFETDLRIANVYRLQYAFVLLEDNKVVEFEEWLGRYNEIVETEIQGENYITTSDSRAKLYKDSTIIIVGKVNELNTKESEINPIVYDDQVLFSSTRMNVLAEKANSYYNVFSASYLADGKFDKINLFNKSLNTAQNEGSMTFFDVTNSIYFTRSAAGNTQLKTFTSSIPMDSNDPLDESQFFIEGFNSIGQMVLNSSGTSMYFVSEKAGGSGGLDIYKSSLVNGSWAVPENIGETINTSGDEIYPYLMNDSILFFSSNGHDGYGGLDLYSINLNNANSSALNLGKSVNTEYDDFSLAFSPGGLTGYFASNRPGGAGKEDIYRVHILNLKIKYAAYRHKVRTSMEDDKVNLYLSNGDEYNITSKENVGFNFGFLPEENFKIIIQHENPLADNIINKNGLSISQREKDFLNPAPINKAEIPLQAGMKYQFTAGLNPIGSQYVDNLNSISGEYQDPNTSTIDLTALAKELSFDDGEIYTIRFAKDENQASGYKPKGESSLFINEETVNIFGRSFFIVLPLDVEANFNIQTDIEYLKENFNPKKYAVVVDKTSVFPEGGNQKWLISMIVNTDSIESVKDENKLIAEEISIIPGTEYILTLAKPDPFTGERTEIFVPLTRGVKYNLGSDAKSKGDYKKALAELIIGRKDLAPSNEEIIDISILSKELEVEAGEELSFSLIPAKQFGKKANASEIMPTTLTLDGQSYDITKEDRYTINVPFNVENKVNIQTDIDYILENYSPNNILLSLDTIPFFSEITVDTTGFANREEADWLSMSINTESTDEVDKKNQFMAQEVSIIPGKEYILTVSKIDGITGKESEIIVPLTRKVKYDFTSNPQPEAAYNESLNLFLENQEDYETTGGEVIDINMLSKELEIKEGDKVSFSLLPAKVFTKGKLDSEVTLSSLYLDKKVVEFTQIQKYTIKVPLNTDRQVNIQTDIDHLQENFEPGTYLLDLDTISIFSMIAVDTTGYSYLISKEDEITDPVFNVVVVNFNLNEYSLRTDAKSTVDSKVVKELKADARLYVTITGYTDGLGNAEYNKKLSKDRAQSVKDFLANSGIGESRIRTFSFGESQALKEGVSWEDLDESELEKHRKVEIVIYLPE